MTDRAPAPADVEAIAEVLAEFWWGCQGGVGADTPPPNDGDRNLAAALLASPALATLRAHERAEALRDAADDLATKRDRGPGYYDRERLRELLAAATPGPWEVLGNNQGHPAGYEWLVWSPSVESEDDTGFVGGRGAMDETGIIDCSLWGQRDAALIAAAVNALPALLDAADERDRIVAAVEGLADECASSGCVHLNTLWGRLRAVILVYHLSDAMPPNPCETCADPTRPCATCGGM